MQLPVTDRTHQALSLRGDRTAKAAATATGGCALFQVVAEHLDTFLARLEVDGCERSLPGFVRRELGDRLRCGTLAHGFCPCSARSAGSLLGAERHDYHPTRLADGLGAPLDGLPRLDMDVELDPLDAGADYEDR